MLDYKPSRPRRTPCATCGRQAPPYAMHKDGSARCLACSLDGRAAPESLPMISDYEQLMAEAVYVLGIKVVEAFLLAGAESRGCPGEESKDRGWITSVSLHPRAESFSSEVPTGMGKSC